MVQLGLMLDSTHHDILGTIFPADQLNGPKTPFKPNQTATKLQHKEL